MNRYLLILLLLISRASFAQSILNSAGGTNGILFENNFSNLNYSFAESKFTVSFKKNDLRIKVIPISDKNAVKGSKYVKEEIPNIPIRFYYFKKQSAFDISLSTFSKGKLDLFSKDIFTPNIEFSFTQHWTNLTDKAKKYSFFIRPSLGIYRRKNVFQTPENLFEINKQGAINVSLAAGINLNTNEDLIFSLSTASHRNVNSDLLLKKKSHCVSEQNGFDKDGSAITISSCEKLPFGELDNISFWEFRADGLYRPAFLKSKNYASIGLIGSFVTMLNEGKPSYNFAIGPAVFDKDNPGNIIFSMLIEFLDINKAFASTENFDNIFGIRAYIGVPFSKLGLTKAGEKSRREEVQR